MPDNILTAAIIPLDIKHLDSEANVANAVARIEALGAEAHLAVLPEMFNTGFTPHINTIGNIAQPSDGPAITTLRETSARRGLAICGSFLARDDNNRFFNRGFIIDPDTDSITFYDKHHLFRYGGENKVLTRGEKPAPIVDFRGWHLRLSLCYDIRFPVWNRARSNDYDVLIVPANWPHARYFAWRHLLIARAIENQCYVLGCNREGNDLYGAYSPGESMALDYRGKDSGSTLPDGSVVTYLDGPALERERERFAPWRDADSFELL